MATLTTLRDEVKRRVKDTALKFSDADKEAFVLEAVKQYSRDKPRLRDAELTGDGSAQQFVIPTGWTDGFSVVQQVEYPIDNYPPLFLDLQDNVIIMQKAGVPKVILSKLVLGSGEKARIFYFTPHTVDGSSSTLPVPDEEAVVNLACSFLCRGLSAYYAEETETTLTIDVASRKSQADSFNMQSDRFSRLYKEQIEGGDIQTGDIIHHDIDMRAQGGFPLLFHPSEDR